MLFNSAFISGFLFASAVLAVRPRENYRAGLRSHVKKSTDNASDEIEYSNTWSGAAWLEGNGTFNSVVGTFTVPNTTGQNGAGVSFWVGIDGATCTSTILQTGVTAYVNGTEASYYAWYEWYPDYSVPFSDLSVSAGDVIRANVTAFSTTSGIATIENLTTGQSKHEQLSSTYPLCGQNAEWIVDDYSDDNNNTVPFANFGTVTFKDGKATGPRGTFAFSGATIIEMVENGEPATSVTIDGTYLTIKDS